VQKGNGKLIDRTALNSETQDLSIDQWFNLLSLVVSLQTTRFYIQKFYMVLSLL